MRTAGSGSICHSEYSRFLCDGIEIIARIDLFSERLIKHVNSTYLTTQLGLTDGNVGFERDNSG